MATSFQYSIATDFSGLFNSNTLADAIRKSAITIALDAVGTSGDICTITFKADLPTPDVTLLTDLVAAHTGTALADAPQLVRLDAPMDPGNKPIVSISPATIGLKTWLTGAGDGVIPALRGLGNQIRVEFDGTESFPDTKYTDFTFDQPVEVHDGQLVWGPEAAWGSQDRFSLSVVIPANAPTSTPGTGNLNEVPLGGGAMTYVPAAGDGSHTLSLDSAVPVPASTLGTGYWNVDQVTGVITPNAAGTGDYMLYNFEVNPQFITNIGMGHRMGVFDVDVYRCDWVHQSWNMRLSVTKTTTGAGDCSGWILIFRPSNLRQ